MTKRPGMYTKAERVTAWSGTSLLVCIAAVCIMLTIKLGLVLFT